MMEVKAEKYFMVCGLVEEQRAVLVDDDGQVLSLPLPLTWADGMVGCVPVFKDHASAFEYSHGVYEIREIKGKIR